MKHVLPSLQESLELLVLVVMIAVMQWLIGSWMWSAFFVLGFIWNWSVLNGWVSQQIKQKQYRFSMLKGITKFHELLLSPLNKFPKLQAIAQVMPAGLAIGAMALILHATVPWWACFMGSIAFILVRRQLAEML